MLQLKFSAWFGNLGLKNKNKLVKVINAAGKVTGRPQTLFRIIFGIAVLCGAVIYRFRTPFTFGACVTPVCVSDHCHTPNPHRISKVSSERTSLIGFFAYQYTRSSLPICMGGEGVL